LPPLQWEKWFGIVVAPLRGGVDFAVVIVFRARLAFFIQRVLLLAIYIAFRYSTATRCEGKYEQNDSRNYLKNSFHSISLNYAILASFIGQPGHIV
jgi:hypothetical protein